MLTARMFSSAKNTFIFKASLYCVSCGVYAFVASNDSTSLVVCQSFFANFFNFFFSGFLPALFFVNLTLFPSPVCFYFPDLVVQHPVHRGLHPIEVRQLQHGTGEEVHLAGPVGQAVLAHGGHGLGV